MSSKKQNATASSRWSAADKERATYKIVMVILSHKEVGIIFI